MEVEIVRRIEKNNTIYSLSGKIELEEIKKILENMEI